VRLAHCGVALQVDPDGRVSGLEERAAVAFLDNMNLPQDPLPRNPHPLTIDADGFHIRYVRAASNEMDHLDAADDLLVGRIAPVEEIEKDGIPCLDFESEIFDPVYENVFDLDARFPCGPNSLSGNKSNDRWEKHDNFVLQATATFTVYDTWEYSFLVNVDDGARLRIDGRDVIVDDGIHPPVTSIGTVMLTPGRHTLELVYYEHQNFARVELGTAVGRTETISDFTLLSVPDPVAE
jgi:hypothetical protein